MRYPFLLALVFLSACDSTPRERQAAVRDEIDGLETSARKGGKRLVSAGRQVARFDSANRARRAQPLDAGQQQVLQAALLGQYADLNTLTPATIAPAYGELLRNARARQATWTARDWDYARAVYRDLNGALKRVRLDLPAREEVKVRARQAAFLGLKTNDGLHNLKDATRAGAPQ